MYLLTVEKNGAPLARKYEEEGMVSREKRAAFKLSGSPGWAPCSKTFARGEGKIYILLLMDAVSAVSYINKLGRATLLVMNSLAHQLWTWCLTNHINHTAENIPGVTNTQTDQKSRKFFETLAIVNSTHRSLTAFNKLWGPFQIASQICELKNRSTDAFILVWVIGRVYAFASFLLTGVASDKFRYNTSWN